MKLSGVLPPRAATTLLRGRIPYPFVAPTRAACSALLVARRRTLTRSLATMATAAEDSSSQRIRADSTATATCAVRHALNSAAPSASTSEPASEPASEPTFPSSSFLWRGYAMPYSLVPPTPLPDYYSLSSWPSDPLRVFVWWYGAAEKLYASLHTATTTNGSTDGAHSVDQQRAVSWPNNMQLATVDGSGQPHVRNVLLKGVDSVGLVFFTNRSGNKGRQLAANPRAAVVFYWKGLERQVRVEGDMLAVNDEESDGYYHSRPVGSQVSAAVSPQSRPISSRAALEKHYVQQLTKVTRAALHSTASTLPPQSIDIAQLPDSQPDTLPSAVDAHSHHQRALQSLAHIQQQQRDSGTDGGLQDCIKRPSDWGGYRLIPRLFEFWEDGQYRLHSRVEYSKRVDSSEASGEQQQQRSTAQCQWDKRFLAP